MLNPPPEPHSHEGPWFWDPQELRDPRVCPFFSAGLTPPRYCQPTPWVSGFGARGLRVGAEQQGPGSSSP